MQRHFRLTLLIGIILCAALLKPAASHGAPQFSTFHTVDGGERGEAIAASYAVPVTDLYLANGVVNPTLIGDGQRLFVPNSPTDTPLPVLAFSGQPVWEIAVESGNPLLPVLRVNGYESLLETAAQVGYAPDRRSTLQTAQAEADPQPTAPPATSAPQPTQAPQTNTGGEGLNQSLMGIQGHFVVPGDTQNILLNQAAFELDMGWAKQQVDWSVIEYIPGNYTVYLEELDGFVNGAFDRDMNVLLSFATAPEWSRQTSAEDGPPSSYEDFYNFLRFILTRYKGKVQAVEIWNEPNLRREWNGAELNGAAYVELLAGAYPVVKAVDPNITVVSAGLAPTGVSNELAVDDRTYFRQMYEAGVQNHADAIGIHPYGWANPPWARCCGDSGGVPSHNNHPSFYFLDTIEDYRAIQQEFGDDTVMWATEFGWGSVDRLGVEVPAEQPFFAYVSEAQQAEYILEAYRIGQSLDYMGPMFLWNLNVSTLFGFDPNQAGYSILRDEIDRPREAFQRIKDAPKFEP